MKYRQLIATLFCSAAFAGSGAHTGEAPQTLDAVVIFSQFADEPETGVPPYAGDLFDPAIPGSFSHFYHTMSSGQFEARGEVLPRRYRSEGTAADYVAAVDGEFGEYAAFIREILLQADVDVDWTRYDNDGPDGVADSGDDDGVVDYLFVGTRSAPRGFIIGGATGRAALGFESDFLTADQGIDGKPIRISGKQTHGTIFMQGSFDQTVGTMAHEFGHALGLPDLYDVSYDEPSEDSAGIGHWGLMGWGANGWDFSGGPVAFSAWSLEQLGWLGKDNERLVEITADTEDLLVEDVHAGGTVYRVPLGLPPVRIGQHQQEYLLLEQRTRTYYNRDIPAEGLLV